MFQFQYKRFGAHNSWETKRGIVEPNSGNDNDNVWVFLGLVKSSFGHGEIGFGIVLCKVNNRVRGLYHQVKPPLSKSAARLLGIKNGGNAFYYSFKNTLLNYGEWRRVYFTETRRAALCFLACCKYGGVSIHRNVAQMIAKRVYDMWLDF